MGNFGEALGGVGDNFLKAYTTLNQDYRARAEAERLKAAQALEEQVKQAKLKEYANKGLMGQAIQAKMEEINKPFMAEYLDPTTGKTEKGMYENRQTFWEHQGQDPNKEYLKLIFPIVAQYNPGEAARIASVLSTADIKRETIDEKIRHNKEIEDSKRNKSGAKTDDTASKDNRKDKIKMFDDAIKDYDKRIAFATKFLEKSVKGGKTYEAMAKSINENQRQKDIAIQRKNAFIGGNSPVSKIPSGFTDTGKTSGGKKVYTDGKGNAWLE
jgi:hypothetical protein